MECSFSLDFVETDCEDLLKNGIRSGQFGAFPSSRIAELMLIGAAQYVDISIRDVVWIVCTIDIHGTGSSSKIERIIHSAFVEYCVGSQKEERDVGISTSQSRDWMPGISIIRHVVERPDMALLANILKWNKPPILHQIVANVIQKAMLVVLVRIAHIYHIAVEVFNEGITESGRVDIGVVDFLPILFCFYRRAGGDFTILYTVLFRGVDTKIIVRVNKSSIHFIRSHVT